MTKEEFRIHNEYRRNRSRSNGKGSRRNNRNSVSRFTQTLQHGSFDDVNDRVEPMKTTTTTTTNASITPEELTERLQMLNTKSGFTPEEQHNAGPKQAQRFKNAATSTIHDAFLNDLKRKFVISISDGEDSADEVSRKGVVLTESLEFLSPSSVDIAHKEDVK
ncbi:hypothetical protein MP638_002316 [Amoeboaphelidium occidentale]|nr:hypothetical protein MP638_002316 [Amoeboaphelidium occidentale]